MLRRREAPHRAIAQRNAELLDAPIDFEYTSKPFKLNGMKSADQVKLFAGHFQWFQPDALDGYAQSVGDILSENPNITERRIATVVNQVQKNIDILKMLAK